jgi:hypothetical protein
VTHTSSRKPFLRLLLLTAIALLIQGYHPYAEDAEIYLPGVEKILHPNLFPVGTEFFSSHASMTLFPNLIAFSIRLTHLPMEVALFAWQLFSIFLLLLACWELASLFFPASRARWGAVCLIAVLLTLPVAGTALYIVDQYLNPRNFAAFAGVFMLARTLEKKYLRALFWLLFAAAMHPLMWVFPFSFCLLFIVLERWRILAEGPDARSIAGLLFVGQLAPESTPAYHEAAKRHAYHYIQNWTWYEILGVVAPLFIFWWFARIARSRDWRIAERVSRAFVIYGLIYLVGALAVDLPARFEALARIQPLRSLYFLYIVMFIMIGGLFGEFALRDRLSRWFVLFIPLGAGMFFSQRALFSSSAHIEWPGAAPKNPWAQAFLWVRQNTSTNAVFAIDPYYMDVPGEDEVGFRCLAERSRLADGVKDNGVVSMFPKLAEEWWAQVQGQSPWKTFRAQHFERLKEKYGASWVVVQQPGVEGFDCPYKNNTVEVCRVP